MKISLAEELLLLAYRDSGSPAVSTQSLGYGLAGALLMELVIAGRVDLVNKRVTVTDPTPTGDPIVDGALARIGAETRKPEDWVNRLSKGLREQLLDRLVETGLLRREQDKVLWVFPRTRYPSTTGAEPAVETETRQRLRAAVDGTGPVDTHVAALSALIRAVRLEGTVFPDLPKRQVRERLKAIPDANWAADAVRKAIQAVEAAAVVAATTAATVAAAGGA